MYVILDLERASSKSGQDYPTQIAAARVDDSWNIIDTYASLIAPQHGLFFDFSQVGYTGHEKAEYANAECAKAVFFGLLGWLRDDDTLCWWQAEAREFFEECCYTQMDRSCRQKTMTLCEYILALLSGAKGLPRNPYRIAKRLGIQVPELMHESMNDVKAICALLSGIDFDQKLLSSPPARISAKETEQWPLDSYLVETRRGIVHKSGCTLLSADCEVVEYPHLKTCIRRQFTPCKCCEAEYRAEYRQRNETIIEKAEYNYVFSAGSKVFHKYTCGCMKNAKSILGTIHYDAAIASGRVPCKLCNPSPNDAPRPDAYADKRRASNQRNSARTLSKKERIAIGRYEQAKRERAQESFRFVSMDERERNDHLTLTQPANVFWAAAGYSTFHTRNCKKMSGLKGLKGFTRYVDAIHAGFSPCKCCKPTAKMDSAVSIPMFSKKRENDSPTVLEDVCRKNGYPFSFTAPHFTFETPVGIWRINTAYKPYTLHHINLAMTPDNRDHFHKQPKIFLSLLDAFSYIQRHDQSLLTKCESQQYVRTASLRHIS